MHSAMSLGCPITQRFQLRWYPIKITNPSLKGSRSLKWTEVDRYSPEVHFLFTSATQCFGIGS